MLDQQFLTILFTAYLAFVLLVCTVIDIRHFIIPNAANAASFTGAIVFIALSPHHTFGPRLLGAIIGAGTFLALAVIFYRIRRYEGLGLGDAKFMLGAGAWVGWQGLAPLVFIASMSALTYILVRTLLGQSFDTRVRIPFAPFLSTATLMVWLLQEFGEGLWME